MRKKLSLCVLENSEIYGVDPITAEVILFPNDFRSGVHKMISLGKIKDGNEIEIDVDKEGAPIRRIFDQTVAVHKPTNKLYTREEMERIVNKTIEWIENGQEIDMNLLF